MSPEQAIRELMWATCLKMQGERDSLTADLAAAREALATVTAATIDACADACTRVSEESKRDYDEAERNGDINAASIHLALRCGALSARAAVRRAMTGARIGGEMACDNPNHPDDCTGVGFVMPDGSRLAEHMIECRPRDPGIIAAEAFKARRRLGIGHPDASPRREMRVDGMPGVTVEFSGPTPEGLIQRADQDWRPHGPDARAALPIGPEERDRLAAEQIEACARAAFDAFPGRVIGDWQKAGESERDLFRKVARAVLKAAGR